MRLMPPRTGRAAFVTGATGFVGLNMVKELMIRGWDVTALHRPSSDLKFVKRFWLKLAVGELSDPNSLRAAIPQGTDTVFHVAGNTCRTQYSGQPTSVPIRACRAPASVTQGRKLSGGLCRMCWLCRQASSATQSPSGSCRNPVIARLVRLPPLT